MLENFRKKASHFLLFGCRYFLSFSLLSPIFLIYFFFLFFSFYCLPAMVAWLLLRKTDEEMSKRNATARSWCHIYNSAVNNNAPPHPSPHTHKHSFDALSCISKSRQHFSFISAQAPILRHSLSARLFFTAHLNSLFYSRNRLIITQT